MKILQVITDTDRRGAQVFAVDLGVAMRALGHEVRTVALARGAQSAPLDVKVLGTKRLGLKTLRVLRSAMSDVDVTIAHGSSTGPACALAGIGRRRPFVYRQISDSRFWANSFPRRLRVAAFIRAARRVVALSEEAKETLIEHVWAPRERIEVVPNGVPIGQFHPPTEGERSSARAALGLRSDDFVVGYVGALVPEKGVEDLIAAVGGNELTSLVIAGDGPDRSRLEALVPPRMEGRVRFVGPVSDPMSIYAALDVVALPSRGGDSMPAGLIEAGFCGLPSIATPVGSIEEIVVDRVTGSIVPSASVSNLAHALEDLHVRPDFRATLGDNARVRCLGAFEIGVVAEGWLSVLAESSGGLVAHIRSSGSRSQRSSSSFRI